MSGRVGARESAASAEMLSGGPLKPLDSMSESEILEECATWMAKKNGGSKDQTLATLNALPAAHVKIMLEKLRAG